MFETFEIQLLIIEICTILGTYSPEQKMTTLNYLADEYAAMDDEFVVIIDMIMEALYHPRVEQTLQHVIEQFRHPQDVQKAQMVLQSILTYLSSES